MPFFKPLSFTFEIRDVEFLFENGRFFVGVEPVSAREIVLFRLGKIEIEPPAPPPATIAGVVLDASGTEGFDDNGGDFDILREALIATNLVATLNDPEADFTVFAPTDAAFIQLARDLGVEIEDGDEAGALNGILAALTELGGGEEEGLALLETVLLAHVSPGGQTLEELQEAGSATGASGFVVGVDGTELVDAEPDLENPEIVASDIPASNGVIQAIDRVILPLDIPGNTPSIVDVAVGSADFEILVKAVTAAGLVETLAAATDTTVFAPTDAAFTALAVDLGFDGDEADEDAVFDFLVGALSGLAEDGDPIPLLTSILTFHVSPGAKSAAEIDAAEEIATLNGATFATEGTELMDLEPDLENPNIVIEDIPAGTNLIQAIDRVLLPLDIPGNEEPVEGIVVAGGNGRDVIEGGAGDDDLSGGNGRDRIDGGDGDDMISGGNGRDVLNGGADDDVIHGGRGKDVLIGGEGDDSLTGGRGPDTFDFTALSGDDVVEDLAGNDLILLSAEEFADLDAVLAATSDTSEGALIAGAEGSILLSGVELASVDGDQFVFV